MVLNLTDPGEDELRAKITVFGVGGAGGNAVNNMIDKALEGVDFIAANTDSQALKNSQAPRRIQLGTGVTRGLGAGSKPEVGLHAAEDTLEEIAEQLEGCHMCFITAGMGGGTGTGAAPVVARTAREMGILTVGVVTKPFHFEGARRMAVAEAGVEEMQSVVDTLIVIPNQNLFQVASERTTFVEAFQMADDVLYQGVQGVTDLMVRPGMINLDFADVRSVMEEMGKAMMGTGEADGETRAIDAAEKAIANPLLDEVSLKGARGVLINITGGYDLTLFEMDEAANRIKDEVDAHAMIKFGSAIDPDMEGKMRVSVVATGIDAEPGAVREPAPQAPMRRKPAATDPGFIAAARGAAGRPEAAPAAEAEPAPAEFDEPEFPEPAVADLPDPDHPPRTPDPAPSRAPERTAERAPERQPARAPERAAPVRAASERAPERAPDRHIERPAEPVRAPERSAQPDPRARTRGPVRPRDDARFATAPSPDDIRSRAEEVRQRALDARARRVEADQYEIAEEPALFELDEGSIVERSDPAPVLRSDPPRREAEPEAPAPQRSGLFTINKLIHRVAGHPIDEPDPEREPRADHDGDDDGGDIPAFLRRQAN